MTRHYYVGERVVNLYEGYWGQSKGTAGTVVTHNGSGEPIVVWDCGNSNYYLHRDLAIAPVYKKGYYVEFGANAPVGFCFLRGNGCSRCRKTEYDCGFKVLGGERIPAPITAPDPVRAYGGQIFATNGFFEVIELELPDGTTFKCLPEYLKVRKPRVMQTMMFGEAYMVKGKI